MYTAKLSLLTLVFLLLDVLLIIVQGAPVEPLWSSRYQNSNKNKKNAIAYQRYVRRRPSYYPNDLYMDEFVEVFYTRLRPPAHSLSDNEIDQIIRCDFNPNLEECKQFQEPSTTTTSRPPVYQLSDEEVERIIRCDFNPNLEECKQFKDSNKSSTVRPSLKPPAAERTTTERTNLPEETTLKTSAATTKRYIEDTTTESLPLLPNISEEEVDEIPTATTTVETIITTTEDLPFLPNIPEEEIEDITENNSVYDYEIVTEENGYDGDDESFNNNDDFEEGDDEEEGDEEEVEQF